MTARLGLFVLLLAPAGCYASHERPGAVALACDGSSPRCAAPSPTSARGVCVTDGEVFVFADGTGELGCIGTDGDATRFGRVEACPASVPVARHVRCCERSRDPVLTGWVFEGTVLGAGARVEESVDGCELLPTEVSWVPYLPWRPTVLCDDPLAWSGVPLVFSLLVPGADGCGGAEHAERCTAERVGDRIVVTTESAPAEIAACDLSIGDRVAHCAVLPLPAGSYEVVDTASRPLGTIRVADAPPGPREPSCTPISS